jgi:hypothetical protein
MQEARMAKSSRLWKVGAVLFTLMNLGGVIWAAAMGDASHAAGHVALQLVGLVVWRFTRGLRGDDLTPAAKAVDEQRMEYLQQSVDAIALEVERIGEKQRFMDKLRVERGEVPPLKNDK